MKKPGIKISDQPSGPDIRHDILDNIPENVFILDKGLKIEWANRAALTERGLPFEEMQGRPCYEVWHSRSSPCDACTAHEAFSTGLPQAANIIFPNGMERQVRHIPFRHDSGNGQSIIEIILDTTIQEWRTDLYFDQNRYSTTRAEIWKAAADKTLDKEELIQRLLGILGQFLNVSRTSYFETTGDRSDAECTVQWCAAGLENYLGEKFPMTLVKGIHARAGADVTRLTRNNIPEEFRVPLLAHFDRQGIQSLLLVLFRQEPFSFFSFSDCGREREWDDTETALILEMMKIVEMRMDQINTELEKSVLEGQLRHAQTLEAIGQLAGGVAHDFNNVLGAISGYAEMIRQKFSSNNPKLEKYASAILSGSRKAAELTAQLLAFARKGRFQKTSLNVNELISHISLLLQHTLEEKVKLVLDLTAENPYFTGDPTQMQNVLLNLAMNGRDAMPGGGTLTIRTSTCGPDDPLRTLHPDAGPGPYIAISVSDTGVGMDDATKAKLFEPFFTTKDTGRGSGLGLASVYGSVKSHNGYVGVQSEIGRGTTVTVFLPVDTNAISRRRESGATGVLSGSGAIAVIDNDEAIRIISKEMLTAAGYAVSEFEGGKQAIDYYRGHAAEVDLFIIDMIMEGMNGRECFRELRKINPGVKAILSSGYSFEGDIQEILSEGISGVLQKPFDSARITQVVAGALKGTAAP
jgi:signal transduction histidine kinase/ActR/RegA family two-component response regulator